MASDYETLLAQQVLNEGHIASFGRPQIKLVNLTEWSVHAVYLLSGFAALMPPAPTAQNRSGDGEDSYMQSSPFMSSSMPQKEDSEEPPAVRTYENHKTEDPLEVGRQYGMIQNARVRRQRRQKIESSDQARKSASHGAKVYEHPAEDFESGREEAKGPGETAQYSRKHVSYPDAWPEARAIGDFQVLCQTQGKNLSRKYGKSGSCLTSAADEPMETTASKYDSQSQEPAPTGILDQHIEEALAVSIATTGGRRRGRRKVMKKKMLKDEEGYLVTKEEPAWESFSEDEPPPKEVAPISAASSAAKGKKAAGKPGQGNIMSFFGKK
ncbi:MAG: hypothetical protein Q9173_000015 [Seirophora scorigena]